MKQKLKILLQQAVDALKSEGIIKLELNPQIYIEHVKSMRHGDFSSNLAMILAKSAKINPIQLAEKIISLLPTDSAVNKAEVAGVGFINFFINTDAQFEVIKQIHQAGRQFGLSKIGAGKKIQVEFVSANPTGPLHIGHGRGAVYGSMIANLLRAVGFEVDKEYYLNDAGRQMDILTTSIWLRYLEECGEVIEFPSNGYRGEYIRDIAFKIYQTKGNEYRQPANLVLEAIPAYDLQEDNKEKHIDALIERTKTLLGHHLYNDLSQIGLNSIIKDIKDDLKEFGITNQKWFSERMLIEDGLVDDALKRLDEAGFIYKKHNATWFAASRLGDEKDWVVIRDSGQKTYFASDIAYHINKLNRGFDKIINIWGADHHGYVPRILAAIKALGADESKLKIILVQFATLYRGSEKLSMSTRSGEFITLRQLRSEVGKDAARFFYAMRKSEQHMNFDLKLAVAQTNENPVFYVQYAHVRVCSVLRQLDEKGWERDLILGMQNLDVLVEEHELTLITTLSRYPEILERAALQYEPHRLIQYLYKLANNFHAYYNAHQFLIVDVALRNARLNLICAVKQILSNGLVLLDINTPESM